MSTRPVAPFLALIIIWCAAACGDRQEQPPAADGRSAPGTSIAVTDPWSVTSRGAGPVRAGMTLAEAESSAQLDATGAAGECTYVRPSSGPEGLMFMVFGGQIARVDVTTPDVPTAEGVRVGDTEARVRAVYGEANVATSPHKYTEGNYLTIAADPAHRLVFETDGRRVTRYRGGRLPEVEWVEGCA